MSRWGAHSGLMALTTLTQAATDRGPSGGISLPASTRHGDAAATLADGRGPDVVTAAAESVEATLSWRFAARLVVTGTGLTLWAAADPGVLAATAAVAIPACVLWRWWSPTTFGRCCGYRVRASVLRILHYGPRWPGVARAAGLVAYVPGSTVPVLPRLHRVVCQAEADELRVDLLAGHTPGDYQAARAALARTTWHGPDAGVHVLPGGQVALRFPRHARTNRTPSPAGTTHHGRMRFLCGRRREHRPATRSPRPLSSAQEASQPDDRFEGERDEPTEHRYPSTAAPTGGIGFRERS
jgi:hypothetical protein